MKPIFFKMKEFQSTYLYKVRPKVSKIKAVNLCFNPRTYIRYDRMRNKHVV